MARSIKYNDAVKRCRDNKWDFTPDTVYGVMREHGYRYSTKNKLWYKISPIPV